MKLKKAWREFESSTVSSWLAILLYVTIVGFAYIKLIGAIFG
jgi:hypothetical protein